MYRYLLHSCWSLFRCAASILEKARVNKKNLKFQRHPAATASGKLEEFTEIDEEPYLVSFTGEEHIDYSHATLTENFLSTINPNIQFGNVELCDCLLIFTLPHGDRAPLLRLSGHAQKYHDCSLCC